MPRQSPTYPPATYDAAAAKELLADEEFCTAFRGAFTLLGALFAYSPKTDEHAQALASVRAIDLGGEWPFGETGSLQEAAGLLARGACEEDEAALVRAYTRLFRGPGHLEAPPWGSVYMDRDKVMYGWTWVELRSWMRRHGFTADYEENDAEDQFGRMLLLSVAVCQHKPDLLCEFLGNHLLCWSGRYLELLAEHAQGATYEGAGVLAGATLSAVRDLFGISPTPRKLYL